MYKVKLKFININFKRLQEGARVAKLLGVDCDDLYKNLLKPRIKVGNEFVTQGRNKDQVIQFFNEWYHICMNF